jgi:ElaB/YqjD/DUF883 family membrane-anchored ribosome-binding protein
MGEEPSTSGPALSGSQESGQPPASGPPAAPGSPAAPGPPAGSRDPEQIREEIEATRQELGDTIEALAEKTDVKAQAHHKLEETKASIHEKKDELLGKARQASPEGAVSAANQASQKARENPVPLVAIGAFFIGFVLGRVTAR